MSSALDWIGQLAQWAGSWIPRVRICQANEGGVRFRRGSVVKEITPGVYVYLPALTSVELISTARRTVRLPPQKLTTRDSRTVVVEGMLIGRVANVTKALVNSFDIEGETIQDVGQLSVAKAVTSRSFDALRVQLVHEARDEVTGDCTSDMRPFGFKVESFAFTTMAETKVYCVVGSGAVPLEPEQEKGG